MVKLNGAALAVAVVAAIGAGIGATAWAQSAGDVITARQNLMKANGGAMQQLTPIVRGQAPWNQQTALAQAQVLSKDASALPGMFPRGTAHTDSVAKNRTLPAVWSNAAGWTAEVTKFSQESARLVQLAQNNDEAGFKEQFPKVGAVCGSCHTAFRAPQ